MLLYVRGGDDLGDLAIEQTDELVGCSCWHHDTRPISHLVLWNAGFGKGRNIWQQPRTLGIRDREPAQFPLDYVSRDERQRDMQNLRVARERRGDGRCSALKRNLRHVKAVA